MGATRDSVLDEAVHRGQATGVGEGSHLDALGKTVCYLEPRCAGGQAVHERVIDRAMHEEPRWCGA